MGIQYKIHINQYIYLVRIKKGEAKNCFSFLIIMFQFSNANLQVYPQRK